ncbi:MAG: ATPase, T2SS/T4P/T4SS family [Proteobacteria bacterium]|nr:ATPase, T2SS/T4P/T4SS family [Pseudomonadota bacterium]
MLKNINRKDIYNILTSKHLISEKQIIEIEQSRASSQKEIEDIILDMHILSEEQFLKTLADYLEIEFVKIDPLEIDFGVVTETVPAKFAKAYGFIPTKKQDDILTIAVSNPFLQYPFYDIEKITGLKVKIVLCTRQNIKSVFNMTYGLRDSLSAAEQEMILKGKISTVDLGNLERLNRDLQISGNLDHFSQPIIQSVNHLFYYAFDQRASDIHLEPKRDFSVVRFRIDGILHNVYMLKKVIYNAIISRIKIMAGINIAERRRPQDGRIKIIHKEQEIELRVSTVSTAFGEKVVLRIFDPDILLQDIDALGFSRKDSALFDEFIHHPYGIILVTGPTGSGKTTTLYSALNKISSTEINICTIEDPIELVHEMFNQVAVNPQIDLTFGSVLRTMLRQDPDIIMVGEIRDTETVQNAIQAALTGHLVFSTLHTNDAPTAITRLIDMGGQPFLIASTLIGVVAQRLVRKICPHCKVSFEVKEEDLKKTLEVDLNKKRNIILHRGKGCLECRGTGYLGRTAVFEIMKVNDDIRELAKNKTPSNEIRKAALKNGMVTLRDNVLKKLFKGITTTEEAAKIIKGI